MSDEQHDLAQRIAHHTFVREWSERHDLDGSLPDLGAAFDDAATSDYARRVLAAEARLDWLVENAHWVRDGHGNIVYTFTTPKVDGRPSLDIRASIDAAMLRK